ncbi:hypothetical protein GCM10008023_30080 [Sphingomonas glacialis]|uniref:Uncharacterized protein n=1 Tax=Sphingomonas glacialis TaxID=658225 RepID=A0ABQ3LRR1_9SPHN|nr:hypothetical protein [Sphingomonas glacialis]GHH21252.1 hypothetical protein GCM10008023_30080 [Sphingomonas glacialis]
MNSEYKSGNSVAQIFVSLVATVLIGSVAIVGTVGPATAAPAAIHTIA